MFDDLFKSLPAGDQQVLLSVSMCARLSGGLVEALSGLTGGRAFLERMEHDQLFCTCIDESSAWFVIHPVFREFLERQVKEGGDVDAIAQHRRAATWFAGQSLWSEAIHHVLAAGDEQRALQWIAEHAMAVVGEGDFLALLAWERQLRERLLDSPVRLRLAFAWALGLTMMTGRAFKILEGIEASLVAPPRDARLRAECGALRAVLHGQRGDYDRALALAGAYEPSADDPPWVRKAILKSASYRIAARLAAWRGHGARARSLLDEGERIAAARDWNRVVASLGLEQARLSLLDGRVDRASLDVRRIEALIGRAALGSREYAFLQRTAAQGRTWLFLAGRDFAEALRAAEPLALRARESGRLLDEFAFETLVAVSDFEARDTAKATARFGEVCRRAAKVGAFRSIADQPVELSGLIHASLAAANAKGGGKALAISRGCARRWRPKPGDRRSLPWRLH